MTSSTPFVITFVCTGNLCRSPLAEQALRAAFTTTEHVTVLSAGTDAALSRSVPDEMVSAARPYGLDLSRHVPVSFDDDVLRRSDLIVTLTREHRKMVATMSPRAVRRTLTLIEFCRLSEALDDTDLRRELDETAPGSRDRYVRAIRLVTAMRGQIAPALSDAELDIADPFGLSQVAFDRAATQIVASSRRVASFFDRVSSL